LFVEEEGVSARSSKEANFGGAICEWASAPPRIALVTKTRGALTGFLRAYGEKFPVAGKFNHKKAVLRGCEKPAKRQRGALLTERSFLLSRGPRLAREQKTTRAEQRAEAQEKQTTELEEKVAELRRTVYTGASSCNTLDGA